MTYFSEKRIIALEYFYLFEKRNQLLEFNFSFCYIEILKRNENFKFSSNWKRIYATELHFPRLNIPGIYS